MWDWLMWAAGAVAACGLMTLAAVEFLIALYGGNRGRWRVERCLWGSLYLGVGLYTASGGGWSAVACAVVLALLLLRGLIW